MSIINLNFRGGAKQKHQIMTHAERDSNWNKEMSLKLQELDECSKWAEIGLRQSLAIDREGVSQSTLDNLQNQFSDKHKIVNKIFGDRLRVKAKLIVEPD